MNFRLFLIVPLCLILSGCGSSYCDEISLEEAGDESAAVSSETGEDAPSDPGENDETGGQEDSGYIYVYACGSVKTPGVYSVPSGSRIFEVLALAGGPVDDADVSAINQAEPCYDGEMIYVPAVGEEKAVSGQSVSAETSDGKININTADSNELQQLNGIGASRAGDIISYREKNGNFPDIESIMNVPGIKQGTFDKIKDRIKVT